MPRQLRIEGLTKTYSNGTRALRDVSIALGPGLFGLLGPNGAGKSTLIRTLATLQEPDSGTITLDGIDFVGEPEEARAVLGYLPQDFGVYPGESAEAMLRHLAALKGISGRTERERQVEARLRATNLWEHRRRKLGTFSGGMRQRFGIAQALLGDPQLLIVDEPTAGLDPAERIRFHNLLAAISRDVIVILSTHLVEDVLSLCARMAILVAGRVVSEGEPERTVAELEGQVWERVVGPGEQIAPPAGTQLLSTHLRTGRTIIRVHSAGHPGTGYDPVPPSLEDVYFAALATGPITDGPGTPATAGGV